MRSEHFAELSVADLKVQMKIFCTEQGYDSGQSPEPFVNVTAVPLVGEILQVHFLNACFCD